MSAAAAMLAAVGARIERVAREAGRPADAVDLLAVSKGFPSPAIRALAGAGQRRFGESYLNEARLKMAELADLGLEWHFIGPLQSNKTRSVAEHFAWVHSVVRFKTAQRLSNQRPSGLPPLQICIQINISGEARKSGVAPDEASALIRAVAGLPRLRLRGLMAIPAPDPDSASRRAAFRRLHDIYRTHACAHALDTLSMGMSDDLEDAIAEGATLLRVGSALFGERTVREAGEFGAGLG
jgi:pyridoxal phosphate enzyme (YggS family)